MSSYPHAEQLSEEYGLDKELSDESGDELEQSSSESLASEISDVEPISLDKSPGPSILKQNPRFTNYKQIQPLETTPRNVYMTSPAINPPPTIVSKHSVNSTTQSPNIKSPIMDSPTSSKETLDHRSNSPFGLDAVETSPEKPPESTSSMKYDRRQDSIEDSIRHQKSIRHPENIRQNVVQISAFKSRKHPMAPFIKGATVEVKGSGFVIEGHPNKIITAAHVVSNTLTENGIKVWFPGMDKTQPIRAKINTLIPEIDVAILRIEGNSKLSGFELGSIRSLKHGDSLTVMGYPIGSDQVKVTKSSFNGFQDHLIPLDEKSINIGQSGGVVLHNQKVIGIVYSGFNPNMANSVAFAIPIDFLKAAESLKPYETSEPRVMRLPGLGFMYQNGWTDAAMAHSKCKSGVYIQWISRVSDLQNYNIHMGDRICAMQGFDVDNHGEIQLPWYPSRLPIPVAIMFMTLDKPIQLKIFQKKENQFRDISVQLKSTQIGAYRTYYPEIEQIPYDETLGVVVMPLATRHRIIFPRINFALTFDEKEEERLVVSYILPQSKAAEMDILKPGDLLESVNGLKVRTMEEYKKALGSSGSIEWMTRENKIMQVEKEHLNQQ